MKFIGSHAILALFLLASFILIHKRVVIFLFNGRNKFFEVIFYEGIHFFVWNIARLLYIIRNIIKVILKEDVFFFTLKEILCISMILLRRAIDIFTFLQ